MPEIPECYAALVIVAMIAALTYLTVAVDLRYGIPLLVLMVFVTGVITYIVVKAMREEE
jgi:hypothetical protein